MARPSPRRKTTLALFLALTAVLCGAVAVAAPAQESAQNRLDRTRHAQDAAAERERVLTTTIEELGARVDQLGSEVAELRTREAELGADLRRKQAALAQARAELSRAEGRLDRVRSRLRRAIEALEELLIDIYKSGQPDVVGVILNSDGFDDLATRATYMSRIQDAQSAIVDRVQELRDQVRGTVERLRAAEATIEAERDALALRRGQLAETRTQIEGREQRLAGARLRERETLAAVEQRQVRLEEIEARLERRIQAQLAASATPALPAGPPIGDESSAGLIWPVEGTLTSPFGPRWGRLHAGIDIAAPGGTPIRAAASGTVAMAGPNGGYGNYTCINHSGGLATCYAHQAAIATSSGASVTQGDVIGYVGNTGNSFGDHLHFEVRVNGVPQDPLGYL